jgi:hypothetical protein
LLIQIPNKIKDPTWNCLSLIFSCAIK